MNGAKLADDGIKYRVLQDVETEEENVFSGSIDINSLAMIDSGEINVVASNSQGSDNCSAKLLVNSKFQRAGFFHKCKIWMFIVMTFNKSDKQHCLFRNVSIMLTDVLQCVLKNHVFWSLLWIAPLLKGVNALLQSNSLEGLNLMSSGNTFFTFLREYLLVNYVAFPLFAYIDVIVCTSGY